MAEALDTFADTKVSTKIILLNFLICLSSAYFL